MQLLRLLPENKKGISYEKLLCQYKQEGYINRTSFLPQKGAPQKSSTDIVIKIQLYRVLKI